jgi:Tfp pilus assembly protein PilO
MMNSHFEDELKQALARVPLPEGFAERVLNQLPAPARKRSQRPAFLVMAAAFVLAAGLTIDWHHQQQERERVQEAQQQLAFALRLTAEKVTVVEAHLIRSAPHLRLRRAKERL